jgi:plastocyanin
MMRRALAIVAVATALGAPGVASAQHPGGHGKMAPTDVAIAFAAFTPPKIDVLVGDTVMWTNDSVRPHTVTASDETWSSARLASNDRFQRRFDAAGSTPYYCSLHPFMQGEVDAHHVLLAAPAEPGAPGRPFTLHGRAALEPGGAVSIEADTGAGFQPVAVATVDEHGAFDADVVPQATATYRAVTPDETSAPVPLLVLDRKLSATATTHGRRVAVSTQVAPASPGGTVVLQLRLRHRFGWWPVARTRLDHHSRARFALRLRHRVPARVVLTLADGATVLATSRTLRVGQR